MNITQLGTLVFDASTNIVVDGGVVELPGVGTRARDPLRPVPISFRIALIRSTRAAVNSAINALANECYNEEQHRRFAGFATARQGTLVFFDSALTYFSRIINATVRILSVQTVANGVMATAEITGTLAFPPVQANPPSPAIAALASHETRDVTLNAAQDNSLLLHNYVFTLSQYTTIRDALIAVETRPASTTSGTMSIFSATAAAGNFVLSTWTAGSATRRRYSMTSGTGGTVTYSVPLGTLPYRPTLLHVCVFAPTVTAESRVSVSWDGQPTMTEPLSTVQYIYPVGIYARGQNAATITVELADVPVNTYVDPLIFLPTEGAFTIYARRSATSTSGPQEIRAYHPYLDFAENFFSPTHPDIEVYGSPYTITSDFVRYLYATNVSGSTASVLLSARRLFPALYI